MTAAPRAQRPEGESLRDVAIERVELLQGPVDADDAVPADVVPKDVPGSPLRIDEKDLQFARKVPGADGVWLVPLASGHMMLMTRRGGAEFAPEQLDAGSMVHANTTEAGETVVTGVVADGTTSVTIDTNAGQRSADVREGTYSVTLPPNTRPRSVVVTNVNGQRSTLPLNG